MFCLPKQFTSVFLTKLKGGQIVPEKLVQMTSAERNKFFSTFLGEENAKQVNALFESKLLLKDYKKGLVTWAKKLSGISEPAKNDLISKIEKLDKVLNPEDEKAFFNDLAEQKLGVAINPAEAKAIFNGATKVSDLAKNWDANTYDPKTGKGGWKSEDDRIAYGLAQREFISNFGELQLKGKEMKLRDWFSSPSKAFYTIAGSTKGILAAFDNSFFGRQGLKRLFTPLSGGTSDWIRTFMQSWRDGGKTLLAKGKWYSSGDDAMMQSIEADIVSRPNAMLGKYKAMGADLLIGGEEAFPVTLPEKIPLIGRIYKASEVMFNGSALRLRADYADKMIALAEKSGIDFTQKGHAEGIGALVNAMTGRGNIGRAGVFGKEINSTFFSIRFLKANFDTLTMHRLGMAVEEGAARDFVRKQSALNLLQIVGGIGTVLWTANELWPGSVNFDPHSSNFGKIRIGSTTIDVSGGMGSLVTVASRLVPTQHGTKGGFFGNGWGFWTKSATTGKWTDLSSGKYGQQTATDVFNSFWEGKLSPMAGMFRDIWRGSVYGGQKATPATLAANLITPLPLQTFTDLLSNPNSAPIISSMILDGLGFSVNTMQQKKKTTNPLIPTIKL